MKLQILVALFSLAPLASANAQLGSAPLPQLSASPQAPPLEAIQAWVSGKFVEAGVYSRDPKDWAATRIAFEGCTMSVYEVRGPLRGPPFQADRVFRQVVSLTEIDFDEFHSKYSMFSTIGERESVWMQGDDRSYLRTASSLAAVQANVDLYVAQAAQALPAGTLVPNISANRLYGIKINLLSMSFPGEEIRLRVVQALRDAAKQCTALAAKKPVSTKKPGELY